MAVVAPQGRAPPRGGGLAMAGMVGTPLLEIEKLTLRFRGLTAVNAVDLAVNEGEIVAIIGPHGAGKTSIFNAITGINEPTAGAGCGWPGGTCASRPRGRATSAGRWPGSSWGWSCSCGSPTSTSSGPRS